MTQDHGCEPFGGIQPAPQVRCLVPRQKVVLPPTGRTPTGPIGPIQIGLVELPPRTAACELPGLQVAAEVEDPAIGRSRRIGPATEVVPFLKHSFADLRRPACARSERLGLTPRARCPRGSRQDAGATFLITVLTACWRRWRHSRRVTWQRIARCLCTGPPQFFDGTSSSSVWLRPRDC